MKAIKNKPLIQQVISKIKEIVPSEEIKITHVCGTHEMTATRFGIRSIIPKNIDLIPGPGCPVCVCPTNEIDIAIELAKNGKIVTTFGDMLKVPASKTSLAETKRDGGDIRVVYSPNDALTIAKENPNKEIIFLAIGFETSAPMTGAVILTTPPDNFSIISAHRLTVPAMELLLNFEKKKTKAFICPGHVSVIIGTKCYKPFSEKYNMPCIITGFEAIDMLIGILKSLVLINHNESKVINEYVRVVKPDGNKKALEIIDKVFDKVDASWRGIGIVKRSGLEISDKFSDFDAKKKFDLSIENSIDIPAGCQCHEVMLGNKSPTECKLYLKKCLPDSPIGPCMVSHEGTCAIYARYGSIDLLKFE